MVLGHRKVLEATAVVAAVLAADTAGALPPGTAQVASGFTGRLGFRV